MVTAQVGTIFCVSHISMTVFNHAQITVVAQSFKHWKTFFFYRGMLRSLLISLFSLSILPFFTVALGALQYLVALLSARQIGEIDFSPRLVVYTDVSYILLLPKFHCKWFYVSCFYCASFVTCVQYKVEFKEKCTHNFDPIKQNSK